MADLHAVVKAYDIRGTVPDQLDENLARALGIAFASFSGASTVVVAHDMRPSGPGLLEAFQQGLTSMGVDVVNLGLASTDLLYFASGSMTSVMSCPFERCVARDGAAQLQQSYLISGRWLACAMQSQPSLRARFEPSSGTLDVSSYQRGV